MQDLKVTLIQSDLHWQSVTANLAMLEEKIWQIDAPTDLILLPEMFNTGFSMETSQLAEPMNFTTFKWMKQMSKQTKAVVVGSIIIKENDKFYNRLIWMRPNGTFESYDKRHLFRMANEHHHFDPGTERLIVSLNGWNICPMICYDLRFPVWSRNLNVDGTPEYDLLIYVANWPAPRVNAWDTLLKGRAIENLSFCVGLNRTGEDGNGIHYLGHSAVVDPKGYVICDLGENENLKSIVLSKKEVNIYRSKFPAHLDSDQFKIN
ncbi:MAG: amidohydrolase [Bacteroidota bacterium]